MLGDRVYICLALLDTVKWFFQNLYQYTLPPAGYEISSCKKKKGKFQLLHIYTPLRTAISLILAILVGIRQYLTYFALNN